MANIEKVSGCFYISQALCYKRPERVSPAFFARRKREGRIGNAEVSYNIWAGGRMQHPGCMRMCWLHTAPTTVCVGIKYPKPLIPDVSMPVKLIILTFPCTMAQDFFLYPELSEKGAARAGWL